MKNSGKEKNKPHHRLEHWIKEKMIEKNNAIRLTAAKKTIEKLEKNK